MDVTIIGAGNMGRGLGTRLVAGGNDVKILDSDPDQARELAAELGGGAEAGASGDPLDGDVVVLAIWYEPARSVVERYGEQKDVDEPERLRADVLTTTREGEIGLLRDLQDLHLLATLVHTTWTVIAQGAQGLRDHELLEIANASRAETTRQLTWLTTRMKQAAPQALIVAP